jgi:glycosyltransferase involved in cell wall biosynthesis
VTEASREIAISVVVPVYNLAGTIAHNVSVIRDRVAAGVDGPIEVIVVSDGSIDRTDEVVIESELEGVRLLHYDRNLGKGYAVKIGALESRGRWIAYCDADLDLDPAALPEFVKVAERDGLDFAIGSKRHPESRVDYPASRRIASWLFQQLVRVLFQLDVRDTQVGLKVFRREVADQVMPLLLVKRYAFDIELLAVARAFGFARVREMPVTLDYQFTGTGVRPGAVLVALTDTLAIFYRLRVLKTYQRKRALFGAFGWTRPSGYRPHVTLIGSDERALQRIDWPRIDVKVASTAADRRCAAEQAEGELLAFVEAGGTPSGNFVTATAPFFARPEVSAVVVAKVAPAEGNARSRGAAAIRESRLGGGSQYYRFMPGNIRYVRDFPSASHVIRRGTMLDLPVDVNPEDVPRLVADRGERVLYTPEAFVVSPPEPLFRRHLANARAYGRARGSAVAQRGLAALRPLTVAALFVAALVTVGWVPAVIEPDWLVIWLAVVASYLVAVSVQAAFAALQYRSGAVGLLVAVGLVLTHAAYLSAFVEGVVRASTSRRVARIRPPQARA